MTAIGIVWKPREVQWTEGCRHAAEYLKLLEGRPWRINYISPDGYKTGAWMREQFRIFRSGKMNSEHLAMLREIGFIQEDRPVINARTAETYAAIRSDA